jgi:hypothetical protein
MNLHLDLHEYTVLVEAAWGGSTGLRHSIMEKAIGYWYHKCSDFERFHIHEFFARQKRYPQNADLQEHLVRRYDPNNQYRITGNDGTVNVCYKVGEKYHIAPNAWADPAQIDRIEHLPAPKINR